MSYQFNLGIAFHVVAEKNLFKVAIRYPDGDSYSYSSLDLLSNQITGFLLNANIQKGEVVAIFNEK